VQDVLETTLPQKLHRHFNITTPFAFIDIIAQGFKNLKKYLLLYLQTQQVIQQCVALHTCGVQNEVLKVMIYVKNER